MHSRGYMTMDPRISTNAATEHVGFSPNRHTSRTPGTKRREVFDESHDPRGRTLLRVW